MSAADLKDLMTSLKIDLDDAAPSGGMDIEDEMRIWRSTFSK